MAKSHFRVEYATARRGRKRPKDRETRAHHRQTCRSERFFRASVRALRLKARKKKQLIDNFTRNSKEQAPLRWLTDAIGLSPKSWKTPEKPVRGRDAAWKKKIIEILTDMPFYGYRKVTKSLHRQGFAINKKKVRRIMRDAELTQKRRRRGLKTTNSRHRLPTFPNLVKAVVPAFPHHVWVSDITYVRLPQEFCYVAIVLDVFTRKVVGWSIALNMETPLVVEALEMALAHGTPVFHHSDRGGQYCSATYTGMLTTRGVKISMADTGVSVDNAYAESFNRTLKVEEVYLADYATIDDACASIRRFIELVYNAKRLHSSLGYLPPEEFEALWLQRNGNRVVLTA